MSYAATALLFATIFISSVAQARITKIVIEKREPFANGHEFPVTGAYERLAGKVYGEVDPKSLLNKVIVNLDKAPRNANGNVEYWVEIFILKPLDMRRGNDTFFTMSLTGATRGCASTWERRGATTRDHSSTPATASSCARAIPWYGADGRGTFCPATSG